MQIFIHGNKSIITAGLFFIITAASSVFISWSSRNTNELKQLENEYRLLQNKINLENQERISSISGEIL